MLQLSVHLQDIISCCKLQATYCWSMRLQHHDGLQQVVEVGSTCSQLDHKVQQSLYSSMRHSHQLQWFVRLLEHTQQPVTGQCWGRRLDSMSLYQCCSTHITTDHCIHSSLQSHRDSLQMMLRLTTCTSVINVITSKHYISQFSRGNYYPSTVNFLDISLTFAVLLSMMQLPTSSIYYCQC